MLRTEPTTIDEVAGLSEAELDLILKRIEVQSATNYPPFFGYSAAEDVEVLLAIVKYLRAKRGD